MAIELDLYLTLASPPPEAPTGTLASVEMRCDALGTMRAKSFLPMLLTDQERADLRWYLEEYWQWPYEQFAIRAGGIEQQLEAIGRRLYDALFSGAEAQRIIQPWNLQAADHRQISILGTIPAALSLPWELLHDGHGFLALRSRNPVSIIRRLPERDLAALLSPFIPPLRVLLITARPEGAGFVDPRGIARELLNELESQINAGTVVVEFLRPPTLPTLRARLSNSQLPPIHILHFDGHGAFEAEKITDDGLRLRGGVGRLAFENLDGGLELVEAATLAQVLQDSGVKLAVLTACQSALGAGGALFSSVASRLIQGGVDAVVAMSASVLVVGAAKYVEGFYRTLATGQQAPLAHERARQTLHDNPKRHPHQRTLDIEGTPVQLQDWWLPHFYQQRPLFLQPGKAKSRRKRITAPKMQGLPPMSRYGFGGRARELLELERHLLRGRLVVIHGFGGIGKTELVSETARWLTRTSMYRGALFVSFEHGGDSDLLLGELGRHLEVYDSSYNPNDLQVALAKLRSVLKKVPTLIIADNLESVLLDGNTPLPPEERIRLWSTLLALRDAGCGVLLTTRGTVFGDDRLAPREKVRHLALGELTPDDAYSLALRLLDSLQISRTRAPYLELKKLLEQLDHHPLAIQLVLPRLREIPINILYANFISLLDTFEDDATTGRNRSLLASLEYSLRQLSDTQRILLSRLALFEGGASENILLNITEISEGEWVPLRSALERAALLRVEPIANQIVRFMHFHPVLAPYLRSQNYIHPGLETRYAAHYAELAEQAFFEDTRNSQAARALVQRELPNLRRALSLLYTQGENARAVKMADRVALFLRDFGLGRELAALRAQQQTASTLTTATDDTISEAEFLHESGQADDGYRRGYIDAASSRLVKLLKRIEEQPRDVPRGYGSYEHCSTIMRLARCMRMLSQPIQAEQLLHRALSLIDALIEARSEQHQYIRQRGMLLTDLGDTLREQGRYSEAETAYEGGLAIDRQLSDMRGQAVSLSQLGQLAIQQRQYVQASQRYGEALELFRILKEPGGEAAAWYQLSLSAYEQHQWNEAERCSREALAIYERHGDRARIATTYNLLSLIAVDAERPAEAEGWLKRALAFSTQLGNKIEQARNLSNLGDLLKDEIRAGRMSGMRLAEARNYVEQALSIMETFTLSLSAPPWIPLTILGQIAGLEGQVETMASYRRRARESYASFAGNRYHIDEQYGQIITMIAAAAQGDIKAKSEVEAEFLNMVEEAWSKTPPIIQRIWAGEHNWHVLAEDLEVEQALLILRVLETLANSDASPQG